MTYREISKWIDSMSEHQKDNDAIIYIQSMDEYWPLDRLDESGPENDVFDLGHPYLMLMDLDQH